MASTAHRKDKPYFLKLLIHLHGYKFVLSTHIHAVRAQGLLQNVHHGLQRACASEFSV